MEQRPLEYTVKIYCEGFTEWYYFEWFAPSILLLLNIAGKSMALLSNGNFCKDTR